MKIRLLSKSPLIILIPLFCAFFFGSRQEIKAQPAEVLGFRLIGTVVSDDPANNFALILVPATGGQGAVREGDRVGKIRIKKIMPGHIVVQTERGEEMITLTSGPGREAESQASKTARLNRGETAAASDDSRLMQGGQVRPNLEGGRPAGLIVNHTNDGSLFSQMGLQDGDIIMAVNGSPLESAQPVANFYSRLKEGGTITLDVKRGGEMITLTSGPGREAEPQASKTAQLSREETAAAIPDYSSLMQEIRVRPNFEGGRPAGFIIYNINAGSLFSQMGLLDGDIVMAVNGRPFESTQPVVNFYSRLKEGGTMTLDVKRGDAKRQLHFTIQ